ncbi:MAG: rhodanese-like domain-containing protein, partial [Pseudomonadota bacterium]
MRFQQADGILDLRSASEYQAGHLQNSTWLTWQALPESLNELPALPAKLFLIGDKEEIEAATLFLDGKGYEVNGSLVIESSEAMLNWSKQLPGLVVLGKESKNLWSPSPLVKEFVEQLDFDPKAIKPRSTAL